MSRDCGNAPTALLMPWMQIDVPEKGIDPWRPTVIARCLDQIARAVERISGIAREINLRKRGR